MNVGVDLGKDSNKISSSKGNFLFNNLIAKGVDRIGDKEYSLDNIDITIDDTRYLVGKAAGVSPMRFKAFSKNHINEYTKVFLLSALSLLDDEVFRVIIGLPFADYKNQRKELATTLRGDYTIQCSGRNRRIIVKDIAVFPQCLGALVSISPKGVAGMIGIGYKDFGFCLWKDDEPDISSSWSYPIGIHEAFKAALPEITREFDYTIEDIRPEMVPVKHYDELKQYYMQLLNKHWHRIDFPLYSYGGGSYWVNIGKQIVEPVYADAIGFRMVANLKWP